MFAKVAELGGYQTSGSFVFSIKACLHSDGRFMDIEGDACTVMTCTQLDSAGKCLLQCQ